MITTGKFERSSCYWGRYTTLGGEPRLIHATALEIKLWAAKRGMGTDIHPRLISVYFQAQMKLMVNSATYNKNLAKLDRVHLAQAKQTSA